MNPEDRRLLEETYRLAEETYRLAEENNRLLRRVRRSLAWSNVMSFFYYALIIGVPVILYYFFLQPYIGQFLDLYRGIGGGAGELQNFGSQLQQSQGVGGLLKGLGL